MDKQSVSITPQLTEQKSLKEKAGHMFKLLFKSRTGMIGFLIVLFVAIVAPLAPVLAPYDPAQTHPADMLQPPVWLEGGSVDYILGTDQLGRDLLSRIIYGTQISLLVGIVSVMIAGMIGGFLGLLSGYYGGMIDTIIMRFVDAFIAIPGLLITLVILTVVGPSLWTLIVVLGVTNWVNYARIVRGEVLSVKERDFVKAARSIGVKDYKIMIKHLIPNVTSSFIVTATLSVASTIIAEAALSFLGMGIQPPAVSWGLMLNSGKDYLAGSWWVATFPGIAITITSLGIIFLGDWLRDVLDPRMHMKGK
ncbi:MAG TPA: ABC transporter permease [Bacillota bacterium]|nr:ABC transporter permease [Bacillota bacterium]